MNVNMTIEEAETIVLEQVKFINVLLEEIRKRNKVLQDSLGMTYAKMIGLGTPFEETICALRKSKIEFDQYLHIIRNNELKHIQDLRKKYSNREHSF